ncbi:hypothetical protein [Herpetosiphon llansteffanensis]|uniref:hypothetical protein n=1 Tax=Herpetosiphon llansteffanensis TaxID=2094568 RepID=UPI0013DF5D0D|nr:hypothetical protein [Herpetosiphon llansteffanensis]
MNLTQQILELYVEVQQRQRQRLLIRAAWMALAVLCLGLIGRNWLDWPLSWPILGLIVVLVAALGGVYAWKSILAPAQFVQMLDQQYQLNAQLSTASEFQELRGGFHAVNIERAKRRLPSVARDATIRVIAPIALEWQSLGLAAVLATGLFVLGQINAGLPAPTTEPLRELASLTTTEPPEQPATEEDPAADPNQPVGNQPDQQPELSPEGQEIADALADGLSDNGATRAAADALRRGDVQQAAEELAKLADQADQLSPQTRNEIADGLEQAAEQLQDQPEVAERLRSDAEQLRGNPQNAADALEDLAQLTDQLDNAQPDLANGEQNGQAGSEPQAGNQPQQGQPGDNQNGQPSNNGAGNNPGTGSRSSPPPSDALGPDVSLPEAPAAGETTPGTGGDTSITLPGGEGTGGGNAGGSGGSVPSDISDPSNIPAELRDAIQDYFGR